MNRSIDIITTSVSCTYRAPLLHAESCEPRCIRVDMKPYPWCAICSSESLERSEIDKSERQCPFKTRDSRRYAANER